MQGGAPLGYPKAVAYWPFDEVNGVAVAEQSTARGAMVGPVSAIMPGVRGSAMHIDAADVAMWVPATAWPPTAPGFAVSLWVRPDQAWDEPSVHELLRTGGMVLSRFGMDLTFMVGQESVTLVGKPMYSDWHHVVASYSPSGEISVSLQRLGAPTAEVATNSANFTPVPSGEPLWFFSSVDTFYGGAMDDLAIFDHPLTQDERTALFARGVVGDSPACPACQPSLSPLHTWRFEEPSYDRAVSELAGQRATMTLGLSEQAPGKVGNGLHVSEELAMTSSFQPGSGALVELSPSLHGAKFTLAAWVRPDRDLTKSDKGMAWFKSDATLPNRGFWFGYDGGLRLTLGNGDQGPVPAHGQLLALSGGVWHHVAATYDGVTTALYLDGQLAGTQQLGIVYEPGLEPLLLCGAPAAPVGAPVFPGTCDEMAMFAEVLTPAHIASLYLRGLAGEPAYISGP